jgi:glyoxylase-like metal-dependent hydrolase (beta-lactamase superfamily II)
MSTVISVGGATVQRIVEQEAPFFEPLRFFPTLSPELLAENLPWLQPRYIDPATGLLVLCVQSYLVRTRHHNILIDSCVGNDKPRPHRPFWDMMKRADYERNLAATGLGFEDIDFVMCTHLHVDHVGWNTRLDNGRWVPTFPKARYLFSGVELDYWTRRHQSDAAAQPWIGDSVLPIVQAGRCDLVHNEHVLDDHVCLLPTPGHTIDHFSVRVGTKDDDAIITGDMVHSPLQARYPDIGMMSDYDAELGGRSRRRVFAEICDTPTLLCTAHFPSPSIGLVRRLGDGYDFVEQRPTR